MKRAEIIEKIISFMSEEFEVDPEVIKPEAELMKTLDLDSLDLVDLVVIIEKNFGFKVEAKDFVNIKTFGDFFEYVCQKLNITE